MSSHPNPYSSARDINPDGGSHAISADPAERLAAERATSLSWCRFPYYPRRYGTRGYRFSLSDSGWITTLCQLTPSAASAQIMWLGGLLASRGMPRYLLECHLDFLRVELESGTTRRHRDYGVLAHCSTELRCARERLMSADKFATLSLAFEARVGAEPSAVRNMGQILVAAVIDERDGLTTAVCAVEAWSGDPRRFNVAWRDAVAHTIKEARAAVAP